MTDGSRWFRPFLELTRRVPRRGSAAHHGLRRGDLHLEPLELRRLLSAVELVADINVTGIGSNPYNLVAADGIAYFTANDGASGRELWRSDGSSAGTYLVEDILPGSGESNPRYLTDVGGVLYFVADDGNAGRELWRSDGTLVGTYLARDICIGARGPSPRDLTNVGGVLYFSANDNLSGYEVWRSDGTTSGTYLVKDIHAGPTSAQPQRLTEMNGALYFWAADGLSGRELWRSDGTSAGTLPITDIRPPSGSAFSSALTNVNGTLFFPANDGVTGYELWRSDGTSPGTHLVADIRPGNRGAVEGIFAGVPLDGALIFRANDDGQSRDEVWRSDGTSSGTLLLQDIRPGTNSSYARYFTNVSGIVYFSASNGIDGYEIWRTDGTISGTRNVANLSGPTISFPRLFTNVAGALYFTATDLVRGTELWRSDGTQSGTYLVADILPGARGSYPSDLTNVAGELVFAANEGVHGGELWRITTDAVAPALRSGSVSVAGRGGANQSYTVPVGSGEQVRTVPLAGVQQFSISFCEHVLVAADDLVTRGSAAYSVAGFGYDPETWVAVWTLAAPIIGDSVIVTLSDSVTDGSGNRLDGEWDNPTDLLDPLSSTVSGDGLPGGDFVFRFTVLAGDANRDNRVDGTDYTLWADHFDNAQGPADKVFTDGDWNGDGHVTGADYTLWANHFGLDFIEAPSDVAALPADLTSVAHEHQFARTTSELGANSGLFAPRLQGVGHRGVPTRDEQRAAAVLRDSTPTHPRVESRRYDEPEDELLLTIARGRLNRPALLSAFPRSSP